MKKETVFQVDTAYVPLLQDQQEHFARCELALFESKNNAQSNLEKVTSMYHSLAKSLCLGNFLK